MDIILKPCPCCAVHQAGYPVPWLDGMTSELWPEHLRWVFRLDLKTSVCPDCHIDLGLDHARESLRAQMRS